MIAILLSSLSLQTAAPTEAVCRVEVVPRELNRLWGSAEVFRADCTESGLYGEEYEALQRAADRGLADVDPNSWVPMSHTNPVEVWFDRSATGDWTARAGQIILVHWPNMPIAIADDGYTEMACAYGVMPGPRGVPAVRNVECQVYGSDDSSYTHTLRNRALFSLENTRFFPVDQEYCFSGTFRASAVSLIGEGNRAYVPVEGVEFELPDFCEDEQ